jgi:hypothetical protein
MNLIELNSALTNIAPRRHRCRARDASAPGPGGTDGAYRFHLLPGIRRTHSSQRKRRPDDSSNSPQ